MSFTEDESGTTNGGDVGGDIQIGPSFSRRFTLPHPTMPGQVYQIDFYVYDAEDESTGNGKFVQTMVTLSILDGDDEISSDIRYWDDFSGDETAEQRCRAISAEDITAALDQMDG